MRNSLCFDPTLAHSCISFSGEKISLGSTKLENYFCCQFSLYYHLQKSISDHSLPFFESHYNHLRGQINYNIHFNSIVSNKSPIRIPFHSTNSLVSYIFSNDETLHLRCFRNIFLLPELWLPLYHSGLALSCISTIFHICTLTHSLLGQKNSRVLLTLILRPTRLFIQQIILQTAPARFHRQTHIPLLSIFSLLKGSALWFYPGDCS